MEIAYCADFSELQQSTLPENCVKLSNLGQNLDFAAASQQTFVTSGIYRFHGFIRTDGLSTDQGIRFRISDAEVPPRLDLVFGQFTGTRPWSGVEQDLVVPPATRLLQVQVIRGRSLKFDNKVGGTAWIDELKLEPISIHSPRQPLSRNIDSQPSWN
jgi:hypothetical protein